MAPSNKPAGHGHENAATVNEDRFDHGDFANAERRTCPAGSGVHRGWLHLAEKARGARCGRMMSIRLPDNATRPYICFHRRTADAGGATSTSTRVRAFDFGKTLRSVLMEPKRAFPHRRGRPAGTAVPQCSLSQTLPLPGSKHQQEFIRGVVREAVWSSDTRALVSPSTRKH